MEQSLILHVSQYTLLTTICTRHFYINLNKKEEVNNDSYVIPISHALPSVERCITNIITVLHHKVRYLKTIHFYTEVLSPTVKYKKVV